MLPKRISAILLLLVGAVASLKAQNTTQSPYSNFGIGELGGGDFAQFSAVGGLSQANAGKYQHSPYNPATAGSLRYTVLDFGFIGNRGRITAGDKKKDVTTGGFSYMGFALPTMKRRLLMGNKSDSGGNKMPRLLKLNMATSLAWLRFQR
jgi:hypothetical protein